MVGAKQRVILRYPTIKFLRGAGTQAVSLNVVGGSGGPVQKLYTSPSLGQTFLDESPQIAISTYINSISTEEV
jgi:hypothetical protein